VLGPRVSIQQPGITDDDRIAERTDPRGARASCGEDQRHGSGGVGGKMAGVEGKMGGGGGDGGGGGRGRGCGEIEGVERWGGWGNRGVGSGF
jgi:hypothetical protein